MTSVAPPTVQEIDELRSPHAPGLLSRAEKDRRIERGSTGLSR